MAPPIPGLRKPVQVPTRTAGDVLIGILAIMALAVLTIGVPIGLITVIGLPVPHGTPGLSVLTHQLGIPSILRVLSVVIWLAWLQLVWCVIVEIKAAARNVGLPAQVPLAGATQSAAHRLVTAALLLFTAGAALSPAFAHAGPPRPSHTVSSVMPGTRGAQGPQSTAPQPVAPPTVAQSPGAAEGLRRQAAGRPLPREPVGDRGEPPRGRPALSRDLRDEQGPDAAGRQQADDRQPHPARLDPADAAGRATVPASRP